MYILIGLLYYAEVFAILFFSLVIIIITIIITLLSLFPSILMNAMPTLPKQIPCVCIMYYYIWPIKMILILILIQPDLM